ncbi:J domain-containing protein [Synechococcus sp. M16CYN]|uniref:J domain-containing protein n=1 Tax=Synechococcus sp. M16CYN TaxID=3103139 RepID=UPI0032441DA5
MTNPYVVLGVGSHASAAEIKAAYRRLVKRHHPDAGGSDQRMLALNAAWEVLGDQERRRDFDRNYRVNSTVSMDQDLHCTRRSYDQAIADDDALAKWLRQVYTPIDRLLGEVIHPFPSQLKALSADPYDDELMEAFCGYLQISVHKMDRVKQLFQSLPTPISAQGFGLSVYHCLSEVEDALAELKRYTLGYVDNYLNDGREMLREAEQRRRRLWDERRRF